MTADLVDALNILDRIAGCVQSLQGFIQRDADLLYYALIGFVFRIERQNAFASRIDDHLVERNSPQLRFLIEQPREAEFDAAVNRVAKKFGERLNFKYTGPWPPYNFVNIRLKLERGTAT